MHFGKELTQLLSLSRWIEPIGLVLLNSLEKYMWL